MSNLRWASKKLRGQGPEVNDHQILIVDASSDVGDANSTPGGTPAGTPRTEQRSFDILRHVRRKSRKSKNDDEYTVAIDVLYENQRGMFFCGIPLFSHLTLLNFDPPPWVNQYFHHSAVDIHSAQVPDPTWEWAWDQWHVDMSTDVDNDGWQYNFAFHTSPTSWHGTRVWFHSFVRRRRWLRKRRRRHSGKKRDLNRNPVEDYFTISSTIQQSTTINEELAPMDADEGTVPDIPTLFGIVRKARLDREKLDAIDRFLRDGLAEVVLLPDHITELMSSMVFHESRRQVLLLLHARVSEARATQGILVNEDSSNTLLRDRVDGLIASITAAEKQVDKLEYWSDRKEDSHLNEEGGADPFPVRKRVSKTDIVEQAIEV